MKFNQAIAALVTVFALTHNVQAAVSDGTPITADTLAPLANWVEQETNTHMQALPIAVASTTKLGLALQVHGVSQARAAAAYTPGRIVISNVLWDPDSIRSQSYIVHELVHHAQLVSRREYPCHAAKEREAYMLQNKWLAEHNEPPVVSQEWIDHISSCTADDGDSD